jgi:uncharacterized membrane protein affecting hemolysin expression
MMFILMFGLLWSVLIMITLGIVLIRQRLRLKRQLRVKEELRLWAQRERERNDPSRVENEETWHRNQEMDLR